MRRITLLFALAAMAVPAMAQLALPPLGGTLPTDAVDDAEAR